MPPDRLSGLLAGLPRIESPDLIVGMDTMDDAGVFRLDDDTALVQTVDFFAPVVNDPVACGRIMAANCLSDIWAMGGRPITAMNILGFPSAKVPLEIISGLLTGASEKLIEAGAVLVGGHTVEQSTVMFGMSVTGVVAPEKAVRNSKARPGDALILTKPLGSGILASEIKEGRLRERSVSRAVRTMERLNRYASEVLGGYDTSAMTDITGFGLLGHALAMASYSGTSFEFHASSVPVYEGAVEAASSYLPGGTGSNERYASGSVEADENIDPRLLAVLYDAQASGGLLASVPAADAAAVVDALVAAGDADAAIVGRVLEEGGARLRVVPGPVRKVLSFRD